MANYNIIFRHGGRYLGPQCLCTACQVFAAAVFTICCATTLFMAKIVNELKKTACVSRAH